MINRQQTVAELVLQHSECAEVFHRYRIDYCCRGKLTLEAAAEAKGLDAAFLLDELASAMMGRRVEGLDVRALSTKDLIEHIVSTHHAYLRTALPFLKGLAAKVARVHGEHNPKLAQLSVAVDELVVQLMPHLDHEEQVLFPALLSSGASGADQQSELQSMEQEHHGVAQLLESIRMCTDGFIAPEWACTSYRTLISELAELERDVHTHVHLENHLLKPRFDVGTQAA